MIWVTIFDTNKLTIYGDKPHFYSIKTYFFPKFKQNEEVNSLKGAIFLDLDIKK